MTGEIENQQAIEAAITRALEQSREAAVPPDFAAKVRQSLPVQRPARRAFGVGKAVAIVMAVLAAAVAFLLAPHTSMNFSSLAFDVELILMVELVGIVYWLAARQGFRR